MSPRTLEQLAAAIAIPTERGAAARAYVESVYTPGRRLSNGYPAGQGGRTQYRIWFGLDGGRVREPVPVLFDRDRDAVALARLLNGDVPAARPAPQSDLRHGMGADLAPLPGGGAEPTGLSVPARQSSAVGTPRSCLACGRDLPPGSRPQRTTCSAVCRLLLFRALHARAQGRPAEERLSPDADSGAGLETVSRPSAALSRPASDGSPRPPAQGRRATPGAVPAGSETAGPSASTEAASLPLFGS